MFEVLNTTKLEHNKNTGNQITRHHKSVRHHHPCSQPKIVHKEFKLAYHPLVYLNKFKKLITEGVAKMRFFLSSLLLLPLILFYQRFNLNFPTKVHRSKYPYLVMSVISFVVCSFDWFRQYLRYRSISHL